MQHTLLVSSPSGRGHRAVGHALPRCAHGLVRWLVEAVLAWLWPVAGVASLLPLLLRTPTVSTHGPCPRVVLPMNGTVRGRTWPAVAGTWPLPTPPPCPDLTLRLA